MNFSKYKLKSFRTDLFSEIFVFLLVEEDLLLLLFNALFVLLISNLSK